jgi:mannose-1-phosphate guanylyltransferase
VVTGEAYRDLVIEQLREVGIPHGTIVLEPFGRNTAPALTLAALAAQAQGDDPVEVVSPADQNIDNWPAFTEALQRAMDAASLGTIVVLGIPPGCEHRLDNPGCDILEIIEIQTGEDQDDHPFVQEHDPGRHPLR